VDPQVVRYSEGPELWESIRDLSDEIWPEYNQQGETYNYYWARLYDVFPEWQFVLYDPKERAVLAEGHTIPLAWDGTDAGASGQTSMRRWPPRSICRPPMGCRLRSARCPPRSRRATGASTCRSYC
jgi:hypothetical protein